MHPPCWQWPSTLLGEPLHVGQPSYYRVHRYRKGASLVNGPSFLEYSPRYNTTMMHVRFCHSAVISSTDPPPPRPAAPTKARTERMSSYLHTAVTMLMWFTTDSLYSTRPYPQPLIEYRVHHLACLTSSPVWVGGGGCPVSSAALCGWGGGLSHQQPCVGEGVSCLISSPV